MERLTKRKEENGQRWIELRCCADCSECCDCEDIWMALDRLAAYEDTGLTPEQCAEYAQAEADGRLVEVVRCGKCRHYNTTGCSDGCGWCENMDRGVFDEHYCSRGERREKE